MKSTLENIHMVERFVEEISDEFYLNDNYYGNILVAVTEAYRNAVIHGNQMEREKDVVIAMETGKDGLKFTVCDEGKGYNYTEYTDKEKLLYSEETKGKGLIMIHSLGDEIGFEEGGRKIEILFRIHGIDEDVAGRRAGMVSGYLGSKEEVMVRKGEAEEDH